MEWINWTEICPETKSEIIEKIENDGYTYPHYDKKNNGVKYVNAHRAAQDTEMMMKALYYSHLKEQAMLLQ